MYTRVQVRIANPITASGKKTQLITKNGVLLCGGSTKLDVRPAGGGMAGVMEEAMALGTILPAHQWKPQIFKKYATGKRGAGSPETSSRTRN